MVWEVVAALVVGIAVLVLVLEPVVRGQAPAPPVSDPEEVEDTPKSRAISALREIEFDRATGKLSETDYEALKATYTARALEVIRQESSGPGAPAGDLEAQVAARVAAIRGGTEGGRPRCPDCGPRAEPEAIFCSNCGRPLGATPHCRECGTPLVAGSRFCDNCGRQAAA
jgi:double zinc ribbon protein